MEEPSISTKDETSEFKKPGLLIGRVGKLPRKANPEVEKPIAERKEQSPSEDDKAPSVIKSLPPAMLLKEMSTPIPYKEPKWSGICPDGSDYGLEVLKSGMIMEKIDLTTKPYFVFGRLANCDVVMAHPTISRHHCVLQYKAFASDTEPPPGFYLYDLGSTHGSFLNRERVKPHHYIRVRVGHQIKFGSSTRTYIVLGPDFDCEGESELTVTEIKQKALQLKLDRDRMIQEAKEQKEKERLEEERRREEQGIDWGMGEDAEDEPDLADNPYATTTNEELYLKDPKKSLRGYFEREGHELTYVCEERGTGQFLCRVELPIDDSLGRPLVAEVMHRGKKKEAVVACAMEGCRLLDRAGLLRQATHESRARKKTAWSRDSDGDSDDDSFYDRTDRRTGRDKEKGGLEGGRTLTYDDLLKQIADIESKIGLEEKSLESLRASSKPVQSPDEGDELDAYMSSLGKHTMSQKAEISKTKMRIQKLKSELTKTQKLADLARPAHLPPLLNKLDRLSAASRGAPVLYGKRIKLKDDIKKPQPKQARQTQQSEFVEEMDSDDETQTTNTENIKNTTKISTEPANNDSTLDKDIQDKRKEVIEERKEIIEKRKEFKDERQDKKEDSKVKRVFGPMRPPENYVVPESYYEQESDRDLGVMEDD